VLELPHNGLIEGGRYHFISTTLVSAIKAIISRGGSPIGNAKFIIENYAFDAKGRASYRLKELTGCVKAALFAGGARDVSSVSISAWKKTFTGKGNASKSDVYRTAIGYHNIPDLARDFTHIKVTKHGPASPLEDIYDAIGVTGFFLYHCKEERKRKRQP